MTQKGQNCCSEGKIENVICNAADTIDIHVTDAENTITIICRPSTMCYMVLGLCI